MRRTSHCHTVMVGAILAPAMQSTPSWGQPRQRTVILCARTRLPNSLCQTSVNDAGGSATEFRRTAQPAVGALMQGPGRRGGGDRRRRVQRPAAAGGIPGGAVVGVGVQCSGPMPEAGTTGGRDVLAVAPGRSWLTCVRLPQLAWHALTCSPFQADSGHDAAVAAAW
jgi:hypothetical protein